MSSRVARSVRTCESSLGTNSMIRCPVSEASHSASIGWGRLLEITMWWTTASISTQSGFCRPAIFWRSRLAKPIAGLGLVRSRISGSTGSRAAFAAW